MFFAHAPAGYLISKFMLRKKVLSPLKYYIYLGLGMIGSIFPDFDLAYYIFLDPAKTPHHYYPTHIPFYWLVCFAALAEFFTITERRQYIFPTFIFFLGGMSHLVLDTMAGGIMWLYPFNHTMFVWLHIGACGHDELYCFMTHWSFAFEILIIAAAGLVYLRSKIRKHHKS